MPTYLCALGLSGTSQISFALPSAHEPILADAYRLTLDGETSSNPNPKPSLSLADAYRLTLYVITTSHPYMMSTHAYIHT